MTDIDIEKKRKFIVNLVTIVGMLFVGFWLDKVIFQAIGGLVGAIAAVAIGWTAIFFTPVFGMFMGNLRVKMIKAIAARNPVEEYQRQYVKKQEELQVYKHSLDDVGGQVANYAEEVQRYQKEGADDVQDYIANLAKLKARYQKMQQRYLSAKDSLADFADFIQKEDRRFKMAVATEHINKAVGALDGTPMDAVAIEAARSAIQTRLNTAFAALDLNDLEDEHDAQRQQALADRKQKALSAPPTNIIEAVPVQSKTKIN